MAGERHSEKEEDEGLHEGTAIEKGVEGNIREKQVKSRYGDIKLWLICMEN